MERVRLVWDFKGGDASMTAEHHARHLSEFARKEGLESCPTGVHQVSEAHVYAFMEVDWNDMPLVRDALRPHRGLKCENDD